MTEGLTDVEAIGKFVASNALPLVVEFNHETAQKIFSGEIKSHLLMFVSKKSDEYKAQHETAQTIAKEYKGQLQIIIFGNQKCSISRKNNRIFVNKQLNILFFYRY